VLFYGIFPFRFIHNLMHRHRGLAQLIDAAAASDPRHDLASDPFLSEETEPAKARAMESSLWEIKTLSMHALPQVWRPLGRVILKGQCHAFLTFF
jgi:hypothetical protein